MTAPMVFIVPVRHQNSVKDWPALCGLMRVTLASIAGQTVSGWECIIVANRGAELPELPAGCSVTFVDLPLPVLPDRKTQLEAYYDEFRRDKGSRVCAGLSGVSPDSHVMIVDFDDFISNRLTEFVLQHRDQPGWNIEKGYVWSGGSWVYAEPRFNMMCGTSHIIRRDVYGQFERPDGSLDLPAVKRRLGSHISIHDDLAAEGHALAPLPFPGAVYRIGNPQSTSGTGALFQAMTPLRSFLRHPPQTVAIPQALCSRARRIRPAGGLR